MPPALKTGYFDSSGSPCLKFALAGALSKSPTEFEAIIDTGFSGFISMPLMKAFPLGLILIGTTNLILADGQKQTKLLARATAHIDAAIAPRDGSVILEPATVDVLVGMDFLRRFGFSLHVSSHTIELYSER